MGSKTTAVTPEDRLAVGRTHLHCSYCHFFPRLHPLPLHHPFHHRSGTDTHSQHTLGKQSSQPLVKLGLRSWGLKHPGARTQSRSRPHYAAPAE